MNEGMTACDKPSRSRYIMGCRCYMCRVANADYAYRQRHREGKSPMVGAHCVDKARKRVQSWLDDGVPLREICRATGVTRSSMTTLMRGKHPHARRMKNGKYVKSKRMSRKNYDAIMKCERICAPGSQTIVDASSLNASLAWLYAHGVTPYQVAKISGIPLGTIYSLGGKQTCEYKTLARLAGAAEKLKGAVA